jgi:hypothetical protein
MNHMSLLIFINIINTLLLSVVDKISVCFFLQRRQENETNDNDNIQLLD